MSGRPPRFTGRVARPRFTGRAARTRFGVALALGALAGCGAEEPAATNAAKPAGPSTAPSGATSLSDTNGAAEAAETWFADVTAASGVGFVHDAGLAPEKHLPETMGAGAALCDFDEDGDLDLYLVQGGPMRLAGQEPGTFRDPPGPLPTNRLFRNDGAGHFEDVTPASGDAADTGYGMGVVCGDVDGDGHVDLFVTNLGPDVLLLGDGRGSFRDATAASGIAGNRWTGGAALFDADLDGDLDLYVVGYVEVDLAHPEWCGRREPDWRSACHPDRYPGITDELWRNRGNGTFELVTAEVGLADTTGKGLGALPADFDDDGDPDLYVANDSVENRLWTNDGTGRFEDATLYSGTGVNRHGATEAGMGLAAGDVDRDGDLDLFVTNFDNESNTLYENEGGGLFADRTVQRGLEAPSRLPVGFGAVLADFDEDADLDLAVANGHIIDNIHLYHDGKTHAQLSQLFENEDGQFRERRALGGALTALPRVGRGLYAGDLDGDGDPDLVLTQCGGPTVVLSNERGRGQSLWLAGLPRGTRVELETADGRIQIAEAGPQPSYFGQSASAVHFGLDGERAVRLRARPAGADWLELAFEPPVGPGRLELSVTGGALSTR